MSLDKRAEELSEAIDKRIRELDNIVKRTKRDGKFEAARQRIKRWKDGTVKLITEQLGPDEAKKLDEERLNVAYADQLANIENEAELYRSFLVALVEQIRDHPEDVFPGATATGVSPIPTKVTQEVKEGFVFIAIPMGLDDPALEDVHEAIKEVAKSQGLFAERVDDPESNERITPRIIDSLKSAAFVVADLTHSRPNVYFEAGYIEGTGRIPVYIARADTEIEFDLQDYPVIFFKNTTELKSRLGRRLSELTKLTP